MRLILIASERNLREHLTDVLLSANYDVTSFGFKAGVDCADFGDSPDLILLDLPRQDPNGWEFVRELRAEKAQAAIVLLGEEAGKEGRIRAFDAGADALLTKPIDDRELLACIRAMLRRSMVDPNLLKVGELELDLSFQQATFAGERLDLTPSEFRLLLLFVRSLGRTVDRRTIAEKVLGRMPVAVGNSVEVLVRRLHQKIDERFDQEVIETVRGRGYRLRAATSRADSYRI